MSSCLVDVLSEQFPEQLSNIFITTHENHSMQFSCFGLVSQLQLPASVDGLLFQLLYGGLAIMPHSKAVRKDAFCLCRLFLQTSFIFCTPYIFYCCCCCTLQMKKSLFLPSPTETRPQPISTEPFRQQPVMAALTKPSVLFTQALVTGNKAPMSLH